MPSSTWDRLLRGSGPSEGIADLLGQPHDLRHPPPPSSCRFSVSFLPYRMLQVTPTAGLRDHPGQAHRVHRWQHDIVGGVSPVLVRRASSSANHRLQSRRGLRPRSAACRRSSPRQRRRATPARWYRRHVRTEERDPGLEPRIGIPLSQQRRRPHPECGLLLQVELDGTASQIAAGTAYVSPASTFAIRRSTTLGTAMTTDMSSSPVDHREV